MSLIRRIPWTQQPQGVVAFNKSLRGAVSIWTGAQPYYSFLNNEATQLNGASNATGLLGQNVVFANTDPSWLKLSAAASTLMPVNEQFTIAILRRSIDTTARASTLWGANDGSVRVQSHAPYADGNIYFDYDGTASGVNRVSTSFTKSTSPETLIFVRRGTFQGIYRNGQLIVGAIQSSVTLTPPATFFVLGSTNASPGDVEEVYLSVVAAAGWTDAECWAWGTNPFGTTFEPRRIIIPVGGTALVKPTLTAAFANSITTTTTLPQVTFTRP